MKKLERWRDIALAAIALVMAACLTFLAALITASIEVSGGLYPVQPYDRWGYVFALLLVVTVIILILGVVELMESPDRGIDAIDRRDDAQYRGATLEVAIGDDEFASDRKK